MAEGTRRAEGAAGDPRRAGPWPAGRGLAGSGGGRARYFDTLATQIRAILAKGGDIETAIATVGLAERDKWQLFADYNGRNVTAAFKELEWD